MTASNRNRPQLPLEIEGNSLKINLFSKQTLTDIKTCLATQPITMVTLDYPAMSADEKKLLTDLLVKQSQLNAIDIRSSRHDHTDLLKKPLPQHDLPVFTYLLAKIFDQSISFHPQFTGEAIDENVLGTHITPSIMRQIANDILLEFKPSNIMTATFERKTSDISSARNYPYPSLVPFLNNLARLYPHHFQSITETSIAFLTQQLYIFIANLLDLEIKEHIKESTDTLLIYFLRSWYAKTIYKTEEEKKLELIKTYLAFTELCIEKNVYAYAKSSHDNATLESEINDIFSVFNIRIEAALSHIEKIISPQQIIEFLCLVLNMLTVKADYHLSMYDEIKNLPEENLPFTQSELNSLSAHLESSAQLLFSVKHVLENQTPEIRNILLTHFRHWDTLRTIFHMIRTLDEKLAPAAEIIVFLEILFPRDSKLLTKFAPHFQNNIMLIAANCYFKDESTKQIAANYAKKYLNYLAINPVNFRDDELLINKHFINCVRMLSDFDNAARVLHQLFRHKTYDYDFFIFKLNELKIEIGKTNSLARHTADDLIKILLQYVDYIKKFNPPIDTWREKNIPFFLGFLSLDPDFDIENVRNFIPAFPNRVPSLLSMALPVATIQSNQQAETAQQNLLALRRQHALLLESTDRLQKDHAIAVNTRDRLKNELAKKRKRSSHSGSLFLAPPSHDNDEAVSASKRLKSNDEVKQHDEAKNRTTQPH